MTDTNARIAANVLLASAGVAAAYIVVTRPPLRRLAFRMARLWLGVCVPAYLADQARQAWLESGRSRILPQSQNLGLRTWFARMRMRDDQIISEE